MHPTADTYLAFILFLPWFLLLGALFCVFPRQPRGLPRVFADLAALTLAAAVSLAGTAWAYGTADMGHGPLWRQLLATVVGYGLFLLCLLLAFALRAWILRRRTRH